MESLVFQDWAILIFSLMALGSLSGFLAGLLGIGGGTVLVPGLFYLFSFLGFEQSVLMHMAVGTSLAIIVPTGLSSARSHMARGAVDFKILKNIGSGIFIGAILGSILADSMSTSGLKLVFASASVVLAGIMVSNPGKFFMFERGLVQPFAGLAGLFAGVIASLMGIGAALLTVPYMSICSVKIHRAIGTSSALGLTVSIPAALTFIVMGWSVDIRPPLSLGYVNLPAWFLIMVMAALFAPLGAKVAHSVSVGKMRKGFAVFMVLVAAKLVMDLV